MNLRPQIFVAMSFADVYKARFEQVIDPAIRAIRVNEVPLEPYRVDFSKSGDSILTDIVDGIAHSQMFLADVSIVGNDSRTGAGYRNGNVMYEVGLAVACRQPSEILLIRDDQDRFLFDVSTIPHIHLDFASPEKARQELQGLLIERLRGRNFLTDARVRAAAASLTSDELEVVKRFGSNAPPGAWGFKEEGRVNFPAMGAIPRLCDKHMIQLVGTWTTGGGAYRWTQLGYTVVQLVQKVLPAIEPAVQTPIPEDKPSSQPTDQGDQQADESTG